VDRASNITTVNTDQDRIPHDSSSCSSIPMAGADQQWLVAVHLVLQLLPNQRVDDGVLLRILGPDRPPTDTEWRKLLKDKAGAVLCCVVIIISVLQRPLNPCTAYMHVAAGPR
jgi:hypothetical protein